MIMRVVLMYFLFAGAIGAVLYGLPVLRDFSYIHKGKIALAFGLGLIMVVVVSLLELAN